MGTISLTLPSDGTTIDAADVNTPFNTISTVINGNIDDDNIKAAANIAGSKLANLAVGTAQIAASAVTSAKVDATVAIITGGTSNKIQSGVATGSASADVQVSFPVAFSGTPRVYVSFVVTSGGSGFASITAQTSTTFDFATLQNNTTRIAGNVNWIAIGT